MRLYANISCWRIIYEYVTPLFMSCQCKTFISITDEATFFSKIQVERRNIISIRE